MSRGFRGAAALLFTWPALAAPVPIVNPGFEADVVPAGAFVVLQPAGWTAYDPGGLIDQADNALGVISPLPGVEFFPGGTPQGLQAAIVYLGGALSGPAGLQQTLAATLQAHTTYTLQVAVGNIASGTSLPGSSGGAGVFYDLSGFPGYRIELLAGATLLAADDNSIGALVPEGQFRTATLQFDSGDGGGLVGQPLTVRLINLDQKPPAEVVGIEVDFDDVRLDARSSIAVPEPAAAPLLTLALWAACRGRRRRR
ncbi:MAG: PEP-CTERM sorting domain-containing protein [Rubrivivax sp.]